MNLLPIPPASRIKEVAEDVMKYFGAEYVKQFGVATVKHKLKAKSVELPPTRQLQSPPPTREWLKEGFVVKQTHREKWARNYLVLKNAADQYDFFYFPSDKEKDDPKKAHGRIGLDNYRCREFDNAEKKEFLAEGEAGLVLDPWYSRRRTWYFKFESEAEMKSWQENISYAMRYAPRPMNPDPVLQDAFLAAYRKAWWYFPGWCGAYPGYGGSETEHLSGMIVDRCDREFMSETYAKIPGGFLQHTMRKKVRAALDASVGSAVAAGWKAAQEALDKVRPDINKAADENLEPVAQKNKEMEEKLAAGAADKMTPVFEKLSGPLVAPLMNIMVDPVVNAFQKLLDVWAAKTKENRSIQSVQQLGKQATSWYTMGTVWDGIREFTRSQTLRDMDQYMHGFSTWRLEDKLQDQTSKLLKNACYTYEKSNTEMGDADGALKDTHARLEHDARQIAMETILYVVNEIILEPFKKAVIPALQDLTDPLKNMIPAGPLQQIMDIDAVVEKVVISAVKQSVAKVVKPLSESKINSLKVTV